MPDDDLYSTIRKKPALARKNARFLSSFYESLLRPNTMLATFIVIFGAIWSQTPKDSFLLLARGNVNVILYFLMVAFTVLTGARLMQSVYLANRDYQSLEAGLSDVLIFAIVVAFTGGAFLKLFPPNDIRWLALVYAVVSLVGVANFTHLYNTRLQKRSPQIDYLIERRIQAVNIITFVHLAVAMFVVFASIHLALAQPVLPIAAIVSTFPTLGINILHSSQLTFKPKFLYSNSSDAPEKVVERFRGIAWRTSASLTDDKIKNELLADEFRTFQKVILVRANREMVGQIIDCLLAEFGYMFRYVFHDVAEHKLRTALRCLITSCGGFGSLGFAWFYAIVDGNGKSVGFIKLDIHTKRDLYCASERIVLPIALVRVLGARKLLSVHNRSKKVIASQPRLQPHELAVTYILVKPEARRKGFASSTLRLLISAVRAQSNDVLAARMLALVRQKNTAALDTFAKVGFAPDPERATSVHDDPFENVENVGLPCYLSFDLTR